MNHMSLKERKLFLLSSINVYAFSILVCAIKLERLQDNHLLELADLLRLLSSIYFGFIIIYSHGWMFVNIDHH